MTSLALNRISVKLLKQGIWPWTAGVEARLPEHFKLRYIETFSRKPEPVHIRFQPEYYKDEETGELKRRQLEDIPALHTKEQDQGLWGGEQLIRGFIQRELKRRRVPHFWRPHLIRRIFYSEILDRWMEITVTHRTLDLIDEALGFDTYILKTHQVDLKSALGMKMKRDMLKTLRDRSMYPDNAEKRDEIYEKYKEYDVLSDEEIDWLGLSLKEAVEKQRELELAEAQAAVKPLKEIYSQDLVAKIRAMEEGKGVGGLSEKKSGIMSRIFGDDSK